MDDSQRLQKCVSSPKYFFWFSVFTSKTGWMNPPKFRIARTGITTISMNISQLIYFQLISQIMPVNMLTHSITLFFIAPLLVDFTIISIYFPSQGQLFMFNCPSPETRLLRTHLSAEQGKSEKRLRDKNHAYHKWLKIQNELKISAVYTVSINHSNTTIPKIRFQ